MSTPVSASASSSSILSESMSSPITSNSSVVLVHPRLLEFYSDDSNSYKQIATLYNPNDFVVKFKVLSTAPKKFTVTEPEGYLNAKSHTELVIKHQMSAFVNENVTEKLRIQIYQVASGGSSVLLSKIDIPLHSVGSREKYMIQMIHQPPVSSSMESSVYDDLNNHRYSSFTHGNSLNDYYHHQSTAVSKKTSVKPSHHASSSQSVENVSYMVILVGAICLGILFMPLIGSTDTLLPKYVHVNYEIKLFASFVLGMVTMVILRSSS